MSQQQIIHGRLAHPVKEAAGLAGVSRSTILKLVADGKLRSIRIAGRRLIPADALRDLTAKGTI